MLWNFMTNSDLKICNYRLCFFWFTFFWMLLREYLELIPFSGRFRRSVKRTSKGRAAGMAKKGKKRWILCIPEAMPYQKWCFEDDQNNLRKVWLLKSEKVVIQQVFLSQAEEGWCSLERAWELQRTWDLSVLLNCSILFPPKFSNWAVFFYMQKQREQRHFSLRRSGAWRRNAWENWRNIARTTRRFAAGKSCVLRQWIEVEEPEKKNSKKHLTTNFERHLRWYDISII